MQAGDAVSRPMSDDPDDNPKGPAERAPPIAPQGTLPIDDGR